MNGGSLHAAAAMDVLGRVQDTRAQNIANANTVGYRKRVSTVETFASSLRKAAGMTLPGLRNSIDFSPGNFNQTDNPLDLVIHGKAFFAVETEQGVRFTRNGNFTLNEQGLLVAADGSRVAGEGGPIQADPARGPVQIDSRGKATQENEPIGALKLVEFKNEHRLIPEDSGRFKEGPDAEPFDSLESSVKQGYLELSNVNGIDEMVQMISGLRAFQAAQKALQGIDRTRTLGIGVRG
ncbi:MAG: flagellar hook basal-body protein [Planctomycetota bacterium]